MRKWLFMLAILALIYALSRINRRKQDRSSFLKGLNETLSIFVWVLLIAYALAFLYWLYTQIFR
jgi:glucan phosphoethanolaminetransferase (alkaline phosphatase superfamily)